MDWILYVSLIPVLPMFDPPLLTRVDSWDTNGAASFSQRFGYMDKGYDFDGTIGIADKALD